MKYCSTGEPTLLVLAIPEVVISEDSFSECFAVPVVSRNGGLLVALPDLSVGPQAFAPDEDPDSDTLVGAAKRLEVPLIEEGQDGSTVVTGISHGVVVLDFSDDILNYLREYDPNVDVDTWITPFYQDRPQSLPDPTVLLRESMQWVQSQAESSRVHFYSAQEDLSGPKAKAVFASPSAKKAAAPKRITNQTLMEHLSLLGDQMKALAARQDEIEKSMNAPGFAEGASAPVSGKQPLVRLSDALPGVGSQVSPGGIHPAKKAALLSGPPPKVRAAGPEKASASAPLVDHFHTEEPVASPADDIASALVQQSSAITALVAHLANQNDPISELSASGSGGGGTKGLQRRERLQSELASRSGGFYLSLMQQIHKRMSPGKPLPKTEADLKDVSLIAYLERHGGYRGQRDLGLTMWVAAHVLDCMAVEDNVGAREYMSLLVVALEQAAADGNWGVAFLLTLIEEPPLSLFQDRLANVTPHGKPFAPLVPSPWAAICLAYIKEMELLSTKKKESVSKAKAEKPDATEADAPSPKRKARFPKKPKDGGGGQ